LCQTKSVQVIKKDKSKPVKVLLETDKFYAWCTCGRAEKMPFCDGAHKGTGYKPKIFKVEAEKEYLLCNCGNSKNTPYCDGTHKRFKN